MPIKAVIFDLDGTLVDSAPDIADALNYVIRPFGIQEVSVKETITLVGEGVTRLIEKLIDSKAPGLDPDVLLRRFLEYYSKHLVDRTSPYPGTKRVLQDLARYKKSVISNKIESFTIEILKALDLFDYFDYVAGGDTVREKKPSPVPVLDVLSHLGFSAEEALFVGDSIYDIQAGRAAGLKTIAALYGYGSSDFSRHADWRINRIEELVGVVREANNA
jgi:phosphoglycolate phosphatase